MDYIEIDFNISPNEEYIKDVLASELGELGFESFVVTENGMQAFCPINTYKKEDINTLLAVFPLEAAISFVEKTIEAQNWNETWEKNYFEPIVIADQCVIRSSFHSSVPKCKYDIVIDPRMSFGTGHHETTALMLEAMLPLELSGKSFLDMGCGTAVLAILAAMKGAAFVAGIDIDEWAYSNALDNTALNGSKSIQLKQGGAELLNGLQFDIIFANINRNILLSDMAAYTATLPVNGMLFMSGFYKEDIPFIEAKATELGLKMLSFTEKNNWVAVQTIKAGN